MKQFKQITNDIFYNIGNYHQLTIDLIEECDNLFNSNQDLLDSDRIQLIDQLGSLSYQIEIALEIFNPKFDIEISDLKDILKHIDIKISELRLS